MLIPSQGENDKNNLYIKRYIIEYAKCYNIVTYLYNFHGKIDNPPFETLATDNIY